MNAHRHYPRPPIVEAVIDVKFDGPLPELSASAFETDSRPSFLRSRRKKHSSRGSRTRNFNYYSTGRLQINGRQCQAYATIFHPPSSFTSNIISTLRFAFVSFSAISQLAATTATLPNTCTTERRVAVTPNDLLEHLVNNRHHFCCRESSQ
jgi:hypothetical protein